MIKTRILVVEDDPNLGNILQEYLNIKGYDATLKRDGEEGLIEFNKNEYDLCLFDVMMPKLDGFSLAEKIRSVNERVPIIFLTAKSMKEDAIQGFKLGADDYMTKPFRMEELLLRIGAIMKRIRRSGTEEDVQTKFTVGKFIFDHSTQKLVIDSDVQKLTSKEADLLKMLCVHKNKVMDRSVALKKIWYDDNYFNSRSMDVYITKLRKYLKKDENLQIINVHGLGFKLVEMNK